MFVYSAIKDGTFQIFTAGPSGASERSITEGQKAAMAPHFCGEAGIVYLHVGDDLVPHVWRMDADGENARALTSGSGESIGDVSRDGRVILFYRTDTRDVLWKLPPDGGQPVRLGVSSFESSHLSPSGDRILHTLVHEIQGQGRVLAADHLPQRRQAAVTVALPPRSL
jgi:Tol biopolymer transport system component